MDHLNGMGALAIAGVLGIASSANAVFMQRTVDFSTDDNGNPIVNGQQIANDNAEFFTDFQLSSTSTDGLLSAAFDSSVGGPNDPSQDTDLIVGLGNVLIFQNDDAPAITAGVFDSPNDSTDSGTWTFDFASGLRPSPVVELLDITLIDIDGSASMSIVLTDLSNNTRTYTVPSNWTNDVDNSPDGYDTLDLTSLVAQLGEGGASTSVVEDAGFDATGVVRLDVSLRGSGAIDNVRFQGDLFPTPGAMSLCGVAGLMFARRRRA